MREGRMLVMAGTGMVPVAKWASPPPGLSEGPTLTWARQWILSPRTIIISYGSWAPLYVFSGFWLWYGSTALSMQGLFPRTIFCANHKSYFSLSALVRQAAWFILTTHALFGQLGNVSWTKYNDGDGQVCKFNFLPCVSLSGFVNPPDLGLAIRREWEWFPGN